ncbi:MAG TPA: flagellar hook-basal body complex protein FliE [Gammaproteobacteria bacterium]|nr:flagellar hook-basal body complex protein FliE [Gammaproteobacteria bacterium]
MSNTITPQDILAQMRALAEQAGGSVTPATSENGGSDFADLLKQSVAKVNDTQQQASRLAEAFQRGDPNVQMSEVMIAMQKSSVSFQAMLEVRNKLVNAYQEIMNMQV